MISDVCARKNSACPLPPLRALSSSQPFDLCGANFDAKRSYWVRFVPRWPNLSLVVRCVSLLFGIEAALSAEDGKVSACELCCVLKHWRDSESSFWISKKAGELENGERMEKRLKKDVVVGELCQGSATSTSLAAGHLVVSSASLNQ